MKSYKILTLIGSVLGLIITVGALGEVGFLIMGFGLNTDYQFVGLAISSSVVYIVALCVAFGIRNTKFCGIVLIINPTPTTIKRYQPYSQDSEDNNQR